MSHEKCATLLLSITLAFLSAPLDTGMSTVQSSYIIFNFVLTVFIHYLVKFNKKHTKLPRTSAVNSVEPGVRNSREKSSKVHLQI